MSGNCRSLRHLYPRMMNEIEVFAWCRERLHVLCPGLTSELIDELSLGWRIVRLDKREHLAEAGRIHKEAFLVAEGLVRAYYPDVEGDVTVNFIAEGDFATHYTSLEAPRPSHFAFQALEPMVAIAFSYEYVYQLSQRRCEMERLLRVLLEYEYTRLMAHTECLLMRNAEERYRHFLQNFGSLLSRISVSDLSSYLGVSRQNLTLIRKRLLDE